MEEEIEIEKMLTCIYLLELFSDEPKTHEDDVYIDNEFLRVLNDCIEETPKNEKNNESY